VLSARYRQAFDESITGNRQVIEFGGCGCRRCGRHRPWLRALAVECIDHLERTLQFVQLDGMNRPIVHGARLHGLHGAAFTAPTGDHEYGRPRRLRTQALQRLQRFGVGVAGKIQDEKERGIRIHGLERQAREIARAGGVEGPRCAGAAQQIRHFQTQVEVVVHDQSARSAALRAPSIRLRGARG
jgi:hypothetical protein